MMNANRFINPLFEIERHVKLINETSLLLKNDGKLDLHHFINSTNYGRGKTYRELLEDGTRDADTIFSGGYILHAFHFHHPWTHCGYLTTRSSADETVRLFDLAIELWKIGEKAEAIYQLGRSIHLVQDIFMPQHSGITAFNGHRQLEKWLTDNWEAYLVKSGGYYHWNEIFSSKDGNIHHVCSKNTYDWIDLGSHLSFDWYQQYFKNKKFNEDTYHKVANKIIPNVLRYSAGYLNKFFYEAEKQSSF